MTTVAEMIGTEGARADPDAIRRVAARLDDISATARSIRSNLTALDSAHWTGTAASAYRGKQNDEIPHELSKLTDSFGIAAQALNVYGRELSDILDQARALAAQHELAGENVDSARRDERQAVNNLREARALRAAATDPISAAHADTHVTQAAGTFSTTVSRREAAEEDIRRLEAQAQTLCDTLQSNAAVCASQLHLASEAGIGNNAFSWVDRNIVDGIPGAIVSDAVGVVNTAISGAEGAMDKIAKTWSGFVAKDGGLLKDVALGVGIALVVVALAGAPEVLAALPAVLRFDTVLDASKGGADLWLAARGEGKWSTVAGDTAVIGTDVLMDKLSGGDEVDNALDKYGSSVAKWDETGTPQAAGWITKRVSGLAGPFFKFAGLSLVSGQVLDPKVLEHLVSDHVHTLLGPRDVTPVPGVADVLAMPFLGPFPALMQGVNARIRTTGRTIDRLAEGG